MSRRVLGLALLGLLVVLAFAPSASGQYATVSTEVELDLPQMPVPPDGTDPPPQTPIPPPETHTNDRDVTYRWGTGGYSLSPTEITVSVDTDAGWMEPELIPPGKDHGGEDIIVHAYPPCSRSESQTDTCSPESSPDGGNYTIPVTLNITVTEEAPSFSGDHLFIEASAGRNNERGNLQCSNMDAQGNCGTATTTPFVSAGALPQVRIQSGEALVQVRGGERRTILVDVQNTGNVETTANLRVRDVPDQMTVSLPERVTVAVGATESVDMVVGSKDMLDSSSGTFTLVSDSRYAKDASTRGPASQFEVRFDVTALPTALVLGQQTLVDVFLFTGVFVMVTFVGGWPLTVWWERRRKRKSLKPGDIARLSRDRSKGPSGPDTPDRKVYGIPAEGDDYVVVEDDDAFESAAQSIRARREKHGVPAEGDDYVIVGDEDIF